MIETTGGRGGGEGVKTRDHLANTRNLLAWCRLGVTLMAFGFSVDKLGLLEGLGGNKVLASHYVGLVAAATGLGIAAAAGIRFMRQRTAIETSEFRPRYLADVVIAVSAAVGGVAAMTQLVLSR